MGETMVESARPEEKTEADQQVFCLLSIFVLFLFSLCVLI